MNLVSIIVPIYNVEPCLRRCLDSVVNQTLKNIEIICVNDASLDNSAKILNEYAKKYSQIKVITFEQNCGVAVARNVGMEQAEGEYIGFVDSDDFVELDFFEKLYIHAKNNDAEIVKAQVDIKNMEGLSMERSVDIKLSNKVVFAHIFCLAIYKKELIVKNHIKFIEGLVRNEDILFPLAASFFANKVETINNTFYHYIRRKNSADSYLLNRKKIEDCFYSTNKIFEFLNKNIDNKNDYVILSHRFLDSLYLLDRVEQQRDFGFVVKGILEITNLVKAEYRQDVFNGDETIIILQYLKDKSNNIDEIIKNKTILKKRAWLEHFRKNAQGKYHKFNK